MNMKRLFWKSRIFVRVLSMGMILLALRQNVLARKKSAPRILLAAILPLSSKPRASRMIFKGIMCCALIIVCVGCKSVEPTTLHHATQSYTTLHNIVDTVVVRDSVFLSERLRGDTVYLTRVEWRDRWRTRIVHDTVVKTDSITQVIEHPPERYIPSFYKRCTIALWVGIALIILGVLLKSRSRNIM